MLGAIILMRFINDGMRNIAPFAPYRRLLSLHWIQAEINYRRVHLYNLPSLILQLVTKHTVLWWVRVRLLEWVLPGWCDQRYKGLHCELHRQGSRATSMHWTNRHLQWCLKFGHQHHGNSESRTEVPQLHRLLGGCRTVWHHLEQRRFRCARIGTLTFLNLIINFVTMTLWVICFKIVVEAPNNFVSRIA